MTEQQDFWKNKEWDQLKSNKKWETEAKMSTINLLKEFLSDVPRDIDVLDCGCNEGYTVGLLHELGFASISGIDVNSKAIKKASKMFPYDSFAITSIEELGGFSLLQQCPYDLTLHCSVLMHVHPDNLGDTMKAIYNLSGKYIFGKELSTLEPTNIGDKVGWKNQFWTRRFCNLWLELFPDLQIVKKRILPMISENNLETEVFLLDKTNHNRETKERRRSI